MKRPDCWYKREGERKREFHKDDWKNNNSKNKKTGPEANQLEIIMNYEKPNFQQHERGKYLNKLQVKTQRDHLKGDKTKYLPKIRILSATTIYPPLERE